MFNKVRFTAFFFFLISIFLNAQKADNYNGNLVEYLTEVNLRIEAKVLTDYCNCEEKKKFINLYQEVAIAFNKGINSHISELSRLKTRDALDEFNRINRKEFINMDSSMKNASKILEDFINHSCSNKKAFWPAAITIAEITGIANSIIGLINEGKKRRDAQRDKLIAIIETFRIPSIQAYECDKENKEE